MGGTRSWVIGICTVLAMAAGVQPMAQDSHKVVVPRGVMPAQGRDGAVLLEDYGAFALYRMTGRAWAGLPSEMRARMSLADHTDVILFDGAPVGPGAPPVTVPRHLAARDKDPGPALHLVQFIGPVKQAWLDQLPAGVIPVHYVEHNAYLVWATAEGRGALDRAAHQSRPIQFSAPYQPWQKLGPTLRARFANQVDGAEEVEATIQILDHPEKGATESWIKGNALALRSDWSPVLRYQNIRVRMRAGDLVELAQRPDVTYVGEFLPRELMDEVQGQIIAGNFDGTQSGPSGPGYLAWLTGKGFSTNQADYPIVDITDDGIGNGNTAGGAGDVTLTVNGAGATTRLAVVGNCTTDASGDGQEGHGHINTSIVGGYDTRSGSPYRDADGFQRGLGISPYGRMAGTKIFTNAGGYNVSACGGTDPGVILANYNHGAAISSNSWGCAGCAGTYDDSSQAYDAGTRDAAPAVGGNQELLFIFAAGNSGPGAATVGTPGNGKNMLTVGASENDRATWTDGCAVGPTGADNAMDVIDFSSRGPTPGNRVKPEVIAPGTHIQGTASTHASYNGGSVCDQYQPTGQTIFASSSGTSHSTPGTAGAASLVYRWLQTAHSIATPSPALVKAYLMAQTTYLTGVSANDTLPSNAQGYGMPNLGMAFDNATRYLVNQTTTFDNTGETWTFNGSVANPALPVRIMMVYTDAPGAIGTSPQVNNLNLSATIAASTTYLGNNFTGQYSVTGGAADTLNNYEGIFLPAGTSGSLDITITAANIAGDGVPNSGDATDQDFALVCYNCAQFPDFTLAVTPTAQSVCSPSSAQYTVNIGSILGYNEAVTLSATGLPAGATVSFSTNPVTPAGSSTMTITTAGVSAGPSTITVQGQSASFTHSYDVGLSVYTLAPGTPTLTAPADGATNQALQPAFSWSAASQAATYTIEVATDAGFATIVDGATGLTSPAWTPAAPLASNTQFWWRVRAVNPCGTGSNSGAFGFITQPLPGDCTFGMMPVDQFTADFESGLGTWTTGGTGGTWAISGARFHAGAQSVFTAGDGVVTDKYVTSPAILLPTGQDPLSLHAWSWQTLEDRTGGCYDGMMLEISTAGPGGPWTQLDAEILVDPYDGPLASGTYANRDAWCGDPQDWTRAITDLTAYAGQTVHLRWRVSTDGSVSREGVYLDDVRVQSCTSPGPFLSVQSTSWSDAVAPGNNNGVLEPGERITVTVTLTNGGQQAAQNVAGTLAVTGGTATMLQASSTYADIAASGGTGANQIPFVVQVSPSHTCGNPVNFQFGATYDPSSTLTHNFSVSTGTGGTQSNTYSYSGPAVAIPDNNPAGADAVLNVPASGTITDANVTVNITHTYDGDLEISLISPAATNLLLVNNRGGGGDNFVSTVLDDEAATAISAGAPPFTGSFRPDTALTGVDGQDKSGNWTLHVVDNVGADIGTINSWNVAITESTPPVCSSPSSEPALFPVPGSRGIPGTQMTGTAQNAAATTILVQWDSTTCTAANYNLVWGYGSQLPTSYAGTYGVSGGVTGLGTNGTAGYTWTSVPDPSGDATKFLWWNVVATDGVFTEGSWGRNSGNVERTGAGNGGASGLGPFEAKSTTQSTCP